MKRILLAGFLFGIGIIAEVKAQQEPQFTHYMHNTLLYNPASAGYRGDIWLTFINHDQWMNFQGPEKDKAPRTLNFTGDGSIPLPKDASLGLGLNVLNDHEGFITSNEFSLSGAYRKDLQKFHLAGGLSLGYISKAIDPNWVAVNADDPHLPGKSSSGAFDMGLGVYANSNSWYAGISALHLTAPRVSWASKASTDYRVARTYFITAGYNYQIKGNADYVLQPSVLIKKDQAVTSFGVAATFLWKQLLWGGLEYRSEQITALSGLIGLNVPIAKKSGNNNNTFGIKGLKVGFSYDLATSQAAAFGGTTEIMVGLNIGLNLRPVPNVFDKGVRYL
jgi:type IX secretion system PorP/SprF family membrane protein